MKISKKFKKAFTLVELVIVIAVIAILSAVSVVAYTAIIKKAHESNDNSTTTQLNYILHIAEQGGETTTTAHDAFTYVTREGFSVSRLKSSDNHEILWDSITKEFIVTNEDEELTTPTRYFKVYDEVPSLQDQKYSIYIIDESTDLSDVDIKVGFDSGSNPTLGALRYTNTDGNPQEVIIRTAKNENHDVNVVINAPNDKVHHYGECDNMTIKAVSESSYFEYGRADSASIHSGRFVVLKDNSLGSLAIAGDDAIIAKTSDVTEIPLTKDNSVAQFEIQNVNTYGDVLHEVNVSVVSNKLKIEGNMDYNDANKFLENLDENIGNRFDYEMSLDYEVRIGEGDVEDAAYYKHTLAEAYAACVPFENPVTIYLLKDIQIDESIVLKGSPTQIHTIDLKNHTIESSGCDALKVQTGKSITVKNGTINASQGKSAVSYKSAVKSMYLILTDINSSGAIKNESTVSSTYINFEGGTHKNFSYSGRFIVCKEDKEMYFDNNSIANIMNTVRCEISTEPDSNGLYRLARKEQNPENPIFSTNDNYTRYASISDAVTYDDFLNLKLQIQNADYEETVTPTIRKSLTLYCSAASYKAKLSLTSTTSYNITLVTGTYTLEYIKCKGLTISTNATVNLKSGTVESLTLNKKGGTLNMHGGTCNGATTITTTVATKLYVYGGTFKKNLTKSSDTGTKFKVYVYGGTYKDSTVYGTFEEYVQSGCTTTTNSSGSITVNPPPTQQTT